jgi:DNA invertase Pin-like site-specific DNA recombinase
MGQVLAYLRCSTSTQEIASQRRQIDAWAAANGHTPIYFEDDACSGRTTNRSGLDALLLRADTGIYRHVVVSELSRLGRSIGHVHQCIERLCEAKVQLVLAATSTVIDYTSLAGRALVGALTLASDVEWLLFKERSARGRATMKAKQIKTGRKPKDISDTVLAALRASGLSVRQIAKELGEAPSTIGRRLQALDRQHKNGPAESQQRGESHATKRTEAA